MTCRVFQPNVAIVQSCPRRGVSLVCFTIGATIEHYSQHGSQGIAISAGMLLVSRKPEAMILPITPCCCGWNPILAWSNMTSASALIAANDVHVPVLQISLNMRQAEELRECCQQLLL